jgi:hypothetical protein
MILECHITVHATQRETAALVAKMLHWKTSEIARDPVLGDDTYFYLTSHDTDLVRMQTRMQGVSKQLGIHGVPVIREKIELVIYDTKRKESTTKESTDGQQA